MLMHSVWFGVFVIITSISSATSLYVSMLSAIIPTDQIRSVNPTGLIVNVTN